MCRSAECCDVYPLVTAASAEHNINYLMLSTSHSAECHGSSFGQNVIQQSIP